MNICINNQLVTLPEDLAEYIKKNGAVETAGYNVYGHPATNELSYLNIEAINQEEREIQYIPPYLIIFSDLGNGDYYCINRNNNQIVIWPHEKGKEPEDQMEIVAESFSDWLELVKNF